MSALVPSAVATLPATICTEFDSFLTRPTASITRAEWPWAVSTTMHVDAGVDQHGGALEALVAGRRGGGHEQAPGRVLGGIR